MNRLIQDLLEVKRIEGGKLALETRVTEASSIINEAVELLRPIAAASKLGLDCDVASDTPKVTADPPRIQQVLSNLVGNAIKFTPAGGNIVLRARPGDKEVSFVVADTGPGIAPDALLSIQYGHPLIWAVLTQTK